jgi:predicted O-methyltransferase YrrM
MSLASNLAPRLRLLRTALTRRYIWHDLTAMVKNHGYELRDIRANVQPFQFTRPLLSRCPLPAPDFTGKLGDGANFALAGTHAWNSERSVSEFIGELAFRLGARTVVELGCYVGWTSAHLALALQAAGGGAKLWCVDYEPRFLAAARDNLGRFDLAKDVAFVRGLSLDQELLAVLPTRIDLLFIDTSHEYEATKNEIATYAPRLAPGGVIVLHDSISQDGVRRAVLDVSSDFEVMTFATEYGNGVTVLRSKTVP